MDSKKEEGRGKREEGRGKKEEREEGEEGEERRNNETRRHKDTKEEENPPHSRLPITFGMNIADRLSPDHRFDLILINKTNTVRILPQDFTRKEFATEEFNLNVGFVFNVGLNEANTR